MRIVLSPTTKELIGAVLLVLILGGGYGYFLRDTFVTAETTARRVSELTLLRSRSERGQLLESVLTETETEQGLLSGQFVDPAHIVPFLDALEAIIPYAGTEFEVTDVRETVENKKSVLYVSVGGEGTEESITRFLELVETLPFALVVEKVSLVEDGGLWATTISIKVHLGI